MGLIRSIVFVLLYTILSNSQAGIKLAVKDKLIQDLGSIGLPDFFNNLNHSLSVPHSTNNKILVLKKKFLESISS